MITTTEMAEVRKTIQEIMNMISETEDTAKLREKKA